MSMEWDANTIAANLRGSDNQLLASVQVRFYTEQLRGLFRLQTSIAKEHAIDTATILQAENRFEVVIRNVQLVQLPDQPEEIYYSFDFVIRTLFH